MPEWTKRKWRSRLWKDKIAKFLTKTWRKKCNKQKYCLMHFTYFSSICEQKHLFISWKHAEKQVNVLEEVRFLGTWKYFEWIKSNNYWIWLLYHVKNYADLRGCYLLRPISSLTCYRSQQVIFFYIYIQYSMYLFNFFILFHGKITIENDLTATVIFLNSYFPLPKGY